VIRRKTILAAATAAAFLLPVALALPASAQPGPGPRCENHINCEQHGPNGDVIRLNIGIGGGNCEQDQLLLVRVRVDAGHAHRDIADAQRAYDTAVGEYNAAKTAYDNGYAAWLLTQSQNAPKTPAAYQATGGGSALHQTLVNATTKRDNARRHLDAVRESARLLDAKIALLTSRINGTECHPGPTTPSPTTEAPVPAPVTDTPPPAVVNNNPTQVIVEGPQPVIVPGSPQVGQAPQGYVSAGGGADAAIVSAAS
jgi:hypothetical protein